MKPLVTCTITRNKTSAKVKCYNGSVDVYTRSNERYTKEINRNALFNQGSFRLDFLSGGQLQRSQRLRMKKILYYP